LEFLKFQYKIWSNFEKDSNLKFDPFSFPYSNYKMEAEFENGSKRKSVDLEKWNNFHVGSFSSFYLVLGE
jgi:hypothetical protein